MESVDKFAPEQPIMHVDDNQGIRISNKKIHISNETYFIKSGLTTPVMTIERNTILTGTKSHIYYAQRKEVRISRS